MLILMCGVPGSGKSTKAAQIKAENPSFVVLSTDALRGVIGTDENDQSVSAKVFWVVEQMVEYFLKRNETVIVDAMNYSIKRRSVFIRIARKHNKKVKAVVANVPLGVALKRNASRARQVPEDFIRKAYKNGVPPVVGEVDEIDYVETP